MKRLILHLTVLVCLALTTTGCLRSYSLLTVNRDGSGTITDTVLFSPRLIQMMESFAEIDDVDSAETKGKDLWSDSTIQADAEKIGPGVTVAKVSPLTVGGYKGYVATFQVADITKITMDKKRGADKLASAGVNNEAGGESASTDTEDELSITFAYDKNGTLVINNPMGLDDTTSTADTTAEQSPDEMRQSLDMMSGFMRGLRMRMRVAVNGTITQCNATTYKDGTITLLEADFDKLLDAWEQDPSLMSSMDDLKDGDMKEIQRVLSKYPPGALVVELEPKITVKFK